MSCLTTGGPDNEQGATLKINQKILGGAKKREKMPNLPESLALELILAEVHVLPRTLGQTKYGLSKMSRQTTQKLTPFLQNQGL